MRRLNILAWHVHGGWMSAFVQGNHDYWLPVADAAGEGGKRSEWPQNVRNLRPEAARDIAFDVAVLQRVDEFDRAREWLGERRLSRDIPVVYVEHNTPQGCINEMRHPLSDRHDVTIVHVTHFNQLFWDCGGTNVQVIEHGIPDPGYRYSGELRRCVAAINEAQRRHRVVGNDLIPHFEKAAPVDIFGIGTPFDLPQTQLHDEMARRRVYLHPYRWTSLGLSMLEAMHLGMPVVGLATTEAPLAVPPDAGVLSNRIDVLRDAIEWLMKDENAARTLGTKARAHVMERYSLDRFLHDWDALFERVVV